MRIFSIMVITLFAMHLATAQNLGQARVFSTQKGAIKGYDPVAYFTLGQAQKGRDSLTYTWQDAVWHFSTAAHRDSFALQPDRYAPQYGGYCAYGWAQGYAVKIEPEAWAIVEGKLYLNYDRSVQRKWDKKRAAYIQEADTNWNKKP